MDREHGERLHMVRAVASEMHALESLTGCALSTRVTNALESVPRHLFMPEGVWPAAYDNSPQPIGCGQTISQPLIVALMTELLQIRPEDVILEIGTGSGYQAAVLSTLARKVYSIEFVVTLANKAAETLKGLAYANVEVKCGDGRNGWPEHAPFDAIIVTAAAADLPPELSAQLKIGGRLVAPLGQSLRHQELFAFYKHADGELNARPVLPVVFVPLV